MMSTFGYLYAVCIRDLCNICGNLSLLSTTLRFLFFLHPGNLTV